MAIIEGEAHWAVLSTPRNIFEPDRPKYSLDLALNKAGVKAMKAEGFNVKNNTGKDPDDKRGDFVTFYTYERTSKGKLLPKPRVFDADKKILNGVLIGNGSKVKVSYNKYDYNVGGRQGSRPVLRDVQIISLLEYTPPDEFTKTEGYVAPVPADEDAVVINEEDDIPFVD